MLLCGNFVLEIALNVRESQSRADFTGSLLVALVEIYSANQTAAVEQLSLGAT